MRVLAATGARTRPGREPSCASTTLTATGPPPGQGSQIVHAQERLGGSEPIELVSPLPTSVATGHGAERLLLAGQLRQPPSWRPVDADLLRRVAACVALALALAEDRRSYCQDQLRRERERTSLQTQRQVVLPLFRASMDLANAAAVVDPVVRDRLIEAVSAVDDAVRWLRQSARPPR